jgi:hypothetical protein
MAPRLAQAMSLGASLIRSVDFSIHLKTNLCDLCAKRNFHLLDWNIFCVDL